MADKQFNSIPLDSIKFFSDRCQCLYFPHSPPISLLAKDGFLLKGFCWRHGDTDSARPVVIVNPATSVRCRYYSRFAAYLHKHGFDVICYDYRGIGGSRPESLKGFDAGWIDWGRLDFEAALQYERAFSWPTGSSSGAQCWRIPDRPCRL